MMIWRSLAVTGYCLAIVLAASLVALHLKGVKLLSVQTASMVPTFRPGDALIVLKSPQLRPGEIVSYRSPRNPNVIISHRLLKAEHGWLTTQGDAYTRPDPSFSASLVKGRAILLLPRLGLVLDVLHTRLGLALAVYLPALLVIAGEARHLTRAYARPIYSVRL